MFLDYYGMSQKNFSLVTAIIFLLIAVLHVLRLLYGWPAEIGGWTVPIWLSVAALIISGYLGYQEYSLVRKV
jgi:uncharacterized membrane protein